MSDVPLDLDTAAAELEAARTSGASLTPFTARFGAIDTATAYAVAERASQLRLAATGARRMGRKIGFTNRTIWERYGIAEPIWGWMYSDSVVLDPGPEAEVDLALLPEARVEPEVVIGLAGPVRPGATVPEIAAAVGWVAFGFEIVRSHYPGWRMALADGVMDASLHGASRVGTPVDPWTAMVDDLASFTLELRRNGEPQGRGRGSDVLDSPLHAVAHLAAVVGGDGLAAGEILTTGTVTDASPAAPGDVFTVQIHGLPLTPIALRCR